MIWDPAGETVLQGEAMHSAARWSPYEGVVLRGRIEATFLRGRKVFDKGSVAAGPGRGAFVAPAPAGRPQLADQATR